MENVRTVDHELAAIERDVGLLLNLTPVNAAEAWLDFERGGYAHAPALQSRPLEFEPDLMRRRLFDLTIEEVDDPRLSLLLRRKRDELAREITLLEDRDTSRFVHGSQQLFGDVDDGLVDTAERLLAEVQIEAMDGSKVTAAGFAEAAERELDHYRTTFGDINASVHIRDDVTDLMVSHGTLLVGASASFNSTRVEALIQHEIGTHVVTYENGRSQPLHLLSVGFPGYDETQEGLAVLAEYAVGGLNALRLRLLAARVVAVRRQLDGASFLEIFDELHSKHGFSAKSAWSITIRVARCGGLTKDVVYLRGLIRLLEFLAQRKRIEPLLAGKMSLDDVPLIDELTEAGIIAPARVRPRWLDAPEAEARMTRVFDGMTVHDLLDGRAS
jgi:uncharacterized protein (TIGR02421 family)